MIILRSFSESIKYHCLSSEMMNIRGIWMNIRSILGHKLSLWPVKRGDNSRHTHSAVLDSYFWHNGTSLKFFHVANYGIGLLNRQKLRQIWHSNFKVKRWQYNLIDKYYNNGIMRYQSKRCWKPLWLFN
jgi:hypothetical protein